MTKRRSNATKIIQLYFIYNRKKVSDTDSNSPLWKGMTLTSSEQEYPSTSAELPCPRELHSLAWPEVSWHWVPWWGLLSSLLAGHGWSSGLVAGHGGGQSDSHGLWSALMTILDHILKLLVILKMTTCCIGIHQPQFKQNSPLQLCIAKPFPKSHLKLTNFIHGKLGWNRQTFPPCAYT